MPSLLKYMLCSLLAIYSHSYTAYSAHLDSLLKSLQTVSTENRDNTFREILQEYYRLGKIDNALTYADSLISFYHNSGSLKDEATARWTRIAILNNAGFFERLEAEAVTQMEWFKKFKMWDRYYQSWQRKCSALHDRGRVQSALQEAHAMYEDATKNDNNIGRAMAYKQMGMTYYDMHQFDEATDAFQHGVTILEDENEKKGITSGLYDFLCKAYDKKQRYEDELNVTNTWINYLDRLNRTGNVNMINGPYCSAYIARTSALLGLKRYKEAIVALDSAEANNRKAPNNLDTYFIYLLKASSCLKQKDYEKALAWTDSLAFIESIDNQDDYIRAEILTKLGRGMEAAQIYKRLLAVNDSIYGHEMQLQLSELNTLLHVDDLKMEAKLERSHYIICIGVMLLILITIMFLLRYISQKKLQREHNLLTETNEKLEQSNKELLLANTRAEESSRMKTNFIQQVSHEIRTPLNVLSGFAQVIATPDIFLDTDTKTDISKRIIYNTNRITELVNKMLELSEVNSCSTIDRVDTISVSELVAQAASQSGIEEQIDLMFEQCITKSAEETILQTQERAATRILVLLLHNAKKFTIDPRSHQRLPNAQARLIADTSNGYVTFAVEDTGIGVPPEEADHIFEEFVQLDNYFDGMGIGLTVARSLSRRLDGDLTLDTNYKGGARFVLKLPISYTSSIVKSSAVI